MVYLIILSFITFLLAFAVKILAACFFVRIFNRPINFRTIFKAVLFYELGVLSLFLINPADLLDLIMPPILLFPTVLLISVVALFFVFRFIMKKFGLLDFKKSLLIFFAMFLIVTPALFVSRQVIEIKIAEKLPISLDDQYNFQEMIQQFYFPSVGLQPKSLIIYERVNSLNDIFLEGDFLINLRQFIMAI